MDIKNTLFYGDNLVWLRDHKYFPDESIDLIYLDPPFNSKANYNLLFSEPSKLVKSQAQIKAFDDTWHWDSEASEIALNELAHNKPQVAEFVSWLSRQGKSYQSIAAYLSMMAIRLMELHRVLKPSGSIYLHCDPTASHYLKIVLDQIFGATNIQNELIWWYHDPSGKTTTRFMRKHDIILFYVKGKQPHHFNIDAVRTPYKEGTLEQSKRGTISFGRVTKVNPLGRAPEDVWEIPIINSMARERLGYPTQKPIALLERIIKASSKEGDIVLDPFCGCGTTIDAAQKHNRRWLGIDVTWLAIDLVEKRLKSAYKQKIVGKYQIKGNPTDLADARALANKNKKEFEIWAISLVGAHPREHDGGVDGIFGFVEKDKKPRTIIVQVKGGESLAPTIVRDLKGTLANENAAIALLITLAEPTSGMRELAIHSPRYKSELWGKEYSSIQIRTIKELLEGKSFDLPPMIDPFKKAKITKENAEQLGL